MAQEGSLLAVGIQDSDKIESFVECAEHFCGYDGCAGGATLVPEHGLASPRDGGVGAHVAERM